MIELAHVELNGVNAGSKQIEQRTATKDKDLNGVIVWIEPGNVRTFHVGHPLRGASFAVGQSDHATRIATVTKTATEIETVTETGTGTETGTEIAIWNGTETEIMPGTEIVIETETETEIEIATTGGRIGGITIGTRSGS